MNKDNNEFQKILEYSKRIRNMLENMTSNEYFAYVTELAMSTLAERYNEDDAETLDNEDK